MRTFVIFVVFILLLVHSLEGITAEDAGEVVAPNYMGLIEYKGIF